MEQLQQMNSGYSHSTLAHKLFTSQPCVFMHCFVHCSNRSPCSLLVVICLALNSGGMHAHLDSGYVTDLAIAELSTSLC